MMLQFMSKATAPSARTHSCTTTPASTTSCSTRTARHIPSVCSTGNWSPSAIPSLTWPTVSATGSGPTTHRPQAVPAHTPARDDEPRAVAYYCERTGAVVTNGTWAWYHQIFRLFRVAVIAQQVCQRYLAKQTTNKE